jgi:hypothetical protein
LQPRTVAFVDVLGFREITKRLSTDQGLFREMRDSLSMLREEVDSVYQLRDFGLASGQLEMTTFSDCWVISDLDQNTGEVLLRTRVLVARLLYLGFLCRGGIASGPLYHSKAVLLGNGLVDAYELESDVARFPRVVIHDAIVQRAIQLKEKARITWDPHVYCRRDSDGCWYLDVLDLPHPKTEPAGRWNPLPLPPPPEFLSGVRERVVAGLTEALSARLPGWTEPVAWLRR